MEVNVSRLYVGNLPWKSTEEDIKQHFSSVGEVENVTIIKDRDTGRSRGFGFVDMENSDEAINQLNGSELDGRKLNVSAAREKQDRNRR